MGKELDTKRVYYKDNQKWFIYVLVDPRTEEVRYVGWTVSPVKRLTGHISYARRWREDGHKARWIREILSEGFSPRMDIIESGTGPWKESEQRWIFHYRNTGARLTNATNGGEGSPGAIVSEETREKLRKIMSVRVFSEEHRSRISRAKKGVTSPAIKAQGKRRAEAVRGTKQSAETVDKRAAALRGRKRPADLMERIRLANTGHKHTVEARRNMSLAHIGKGKGRKASPETRLRISEARKGMKFSESHRAAISVAVKRVNAQKKNK